MVGGSVVPAGTMLEVGRALRLTSVGDHAEAAAVYEQALDEETDFPEAEVLAEAAAGAADADAEPLQDAVLAAMHVRELERAVALLRGLPGSVQDALGRVGARDRSYQAEIFGQDRLGAATLYDLTLEFPTGP